jgi:hypothetical protein
MDIGNLNMKCDFTEGYEETLIEYLKFKIPVSLL